MKENKQFDYEKNSEDISLPKIVGHFNNCREWRVELQCADWLNAFLHLQILEEKNEKGDRKHWIYMRGKKEVQTQAGEIRVKFEKLIHAPSDIDRCQIRAQMNDYGLLVIVGKRKNK